MNILKKLYRRKNNQEAPLQPGDAAFMNDLRESLLQQKTPGSTMVLYLIALVLISGLTWAKFANVEEITQGEAQVISRSREQLIQSLEGGILQSMFVREGDLVEKGQVLLQLDPIRAQASYREVLSKSIGLQAAIARLRAESYQRPLVFPPIVQKEPEIVRQETQAYEARKHALNESIRALQQSYQLVSQEIALGEPLAAKGLLSEVEILRMRRQANDLQAQIVERRNNFQAEASAELMRMEMELSQTSENLVGRADIVERTTVTAPLRGTVKNVRVNTLGGVVQGGEAILEIVPLEDQLLVEGKIKPADVAFLRPGLKAMVKISAYDFGVYGGLTGEVIHISPGTLKDDSKTAAGRPDSEYYRVQVLTDSSTLNAGGKKLPIIAGMVGTVEIRTGEKTILDYLLKPVFKAREAFRER